MRLVRFVVNIS